MTALQKIIKGAKALQKKNKNLSWKDAIKKSSKAYNSEKKVKPKRIAAVKKSVKKKAVRKAVGKKIASVKKRPVKKTGSHKDTKSHNVNIRVVSGLKNMAAVSIIKERLSIIADHEKKIQAAQNNIKWFGKNKALRVQLKKDIAFSRSIIKNSRQAIAIAKKMI